MRQALEQTWEKYGGGVREFLWSAVGFELCCLVFLNLRAIGL